MNSNNLVKLAGAAGALVAFQNWFRIKHFRADIPKDYMLKKYGYPDSKFLHLPFHSSHLDIHYLDNFKPDPVQGIDPRPVLVLVHGTFASVHTWDGWVERLGDIYRIIRLDLPGFGFTGPHSVKDIDYTPDMFADTVRRFLLSIPNSPFTSSNKQVFLAGNSLGGMVCWAFTELYPELVRGLILLDTMGPLFFPPPVFLLAMCPGFPNMLRWTIPQTWTKFYIKQVFKDKQKITPAMFQR